MDNLIRDDNNGMIKISTFIIIWLIVAYLKIYILGQSNKRRKQFENKNNGTVNN